MRWSVPSTRDGTVRLGAARPVFPPAHAHRLAEVIPGARLITVPGMGHALPSAVLEPLALAILTHAAQVDEAVR